MGYDPWTKFFSVTSRCCRRSLLLMVGGIVLAGPTGRGQTTVSNETYTGPQPVTVLDASSISTAGAVLVMADANVVFAANDSVILNPGFSVQLGGGFSVNLDPGAFGDLSPPGPPVALAAGQVSSSGFVLSWATSTDNVGVTGYEVQIDSTDLATVTNTSVTLSGLAASTSFAMTVRAVDAAANKSEWSAVKTVVTTAEDTVSPTVPTSLQASYISAEGFYLGWIASSDNVGVTQYEVRQDIPTPTATWVTSNPGLLLTGLTINTDHDFSVRAGDAEGNWSAWVSILAIHTVIDTGADSGSPGDGIPDVLQSSHAWNLSGDTAVAPTQVELKVTEPTP